MSVTIDGDFTEFAATNTSDADTINDWTGRAPISNIGITTSGQAEGSGCIDGRLQVGTGDATYNHGTQDLTDQHVFVWFRPTAPIDTLANAGVTMRVSGTAGGATNYGQWNVGGSDLGVIGVGGWINFVVDILKIFDSINGTPPAITAPVDTGVGGKFLGGPGMAQIVIDRMVYGSTAIVRGGTGGSPGLWAEAATADLANGHIKNIAGAFFINSRVRFGDSVGTTSTEFSDINGLILFETNLFMAGDLCGFEFAGNSTGTNNAEFGTASGTGVDKIGGSGGVWSSSGQRPFRVEAKDSNMDSTGIFGVTMLNSPALWDDPLRNFKQEDSSGGPSFLDFTREANDATANDASPFPAGAGVNDAAYFGHNVRWYELNVNTGTAGAGTYTVTWEYFNGSTWASLTDLTDGTSAFKTTGAQTVTFAIPDDWAANTVDTDSRYWIRARRDAGTVTTDPDITQCTIALAGDVELEDSSCELIDGSMSSMGAVRIRNGAFCKRASISSTVATAKHAAMDLGPADPAADTVRDMTITNSARGILLKDHTRFFNAGAAVDKGSGRVGIPDTAHGFPTGQEILIAGTTNYNGVQTVHSTSTANEIVITATFVAETFATTDSAVPNTTFNIRAFTLAGNTNDFRVDFPATSTVTINLLEGTSSDTAFTSGNQDNVNSSTIVFVQNVTVTFDEMKDLTEVRIYAAGTMNELDGIEDATAGSVDDRNFAASITAGTSVDYVLHSVLYETIRVESFTWPTLDQTIVVAQRLDRNYDNP